MERSGLAIRRREDYLWAMARGNTQRWRTASDEELARHEQRSGWKIIRRVIPYLWPEGRSDIKARVVLSMAALLVSQLMAVGVPQLYGMAVDALAEEGASVLMLGAVGLTVAYGVARVMQIGFQNLRDVIFARVGQRALRQLAILRHLIIKIEMETM